MTSAQAGFAALRTWAVCTVDPSTEECMHCVLCFATVSMMEITRIIVPALLVYAGLLFISYAVPRDALSRMQPNQVLFLVAITAAFATTVLAPEVPFLRGLLFIGLLTVFEVTASVAIGKRWRWPALQVKDPVLLYYRGTFIVGEMKRNGISTGQIDNLLSSKAREEQIVLLLPNGTLSVEQTVNG